MAKNFGYVVKTELKLSTASVAKLLEDVRGVDRQLKSVLRNNTSSIKVELDIDKRKSLSNIQTETNRIVKNFSEHQAPKIKLKLDIDRSSIGALKHEMAILTNQLNGYAKGSKNITTEAKIKTVGAKSIQAEVDKHSLHADVKLRVDEHSLLALKRTVEEAVQTVPVSIVPPTQSNGRPVASNPQSAVGQRFGSRGTSTSPSTSRGARAEARRPSTPSGIGSTARSWMREKEAKTQELNEIKTLLKQQQEVNHLKDELARAENAKNKSGMMFSKSPDGTKKKVSIDSYKTDLQSQINEINGLLKHRDALEKQLNTVPVDRYTSIPRDKSKREPRVPRNYKSQVSEVGVEHRQYDTKKLQAERTARLKQEEQERKKAEASAKAQQQAQAKAQQQHAQQQAKAQQQAINLAHKQAIEQQKAMDRAQQQAQKQALAQQKSREKEDARRKSDGEKASDYRQGLRRFGAGGQTYKAVDPDKILKNPDVDNAKKQKIMESQLRSLSREAVSTNRDLTRSFEVFNRGADGTIVKYRTNVYEATKWGQVLERNDKSMAGMLRRVGQNSLMYAGITSVFYGMSAGIVQAVQHMAEFEVQLNRIQMITTDLNTGNTSDMFSNYGSEGVNTFKGNISRKLYEQGSRLGVSAKDDVAPVYQSVMARTSLTKGEDGKVDPQRVDDITSKILDYSMITLGPMGINSQEIQRVSSDLLSLMQNMPTGENQADPIDKLNSFIDYMAVLNAKGVNTTAVTDAVSGVSADTSKKNIDEKEVALMLGMYNLKDRDASGEVMTSVAKTFFGSLAKYKDSESVQKALKIADIDPSKNYTQQELIEQVKEKYQTLSSEEQAQFSTYLASTSGKGGKEFGPKIQMMLDGVGTPEYEELRNSIGIEGTANKALEANLSTFITMLKSSGQEISRLIDLMAQLGALDGLKILITTFNNLLSSINWALGGVTDFSNYLEDKLGVSIVKVAVQVGALMTTFKALSALTKFTTGASLTQIGGRLLGVGGLGGTGTIVAGAGASAGGIGASTILGGLGGSGGQDTNTRQGRRQQARVGKTAGMGSKVGGAVGNIGGWLLSAGWGKNAGSAVKATGSKVGADVATKFGSKLVGIIPTIAKLGSVFAKLSLAGLAVSAVFYAFKKFAEFREEKKEKEYSSNKKAEETILSNYGLTSGGKNSKEKEDIYKNIDKDVNTYIKKGMNISDLLRNGEKFDSKKLRSLTKEQDKLGGKLGGKIEYLKSPIAPEDGEGTNDRIKYSYNTGKKDEDGKDIFKEKTIQADDEKAVDKMVERMSGRVGAMANLPTDINSDAWSLATERALEYEEELYRVNQLTEDFNRRMSKLGYDMGTIDLNFMGATGSTSALEAKVGLIQNTMSSLKQSTSDMESKKGQFSNQASEINGEIDNIGGNIVSKGFMSKEDLDNLNAKYSIALEAGDTSLVTSQYSTDESFFDKYEEDQINDGKSKKKAKKATDKKREENFRISEYFASISASKGFLDAEQQIEDQMLQTNIAIQEREAQLKELRAQLLYTASGVEVFTAKISQIQTAVGSASSLFSMADTYDEKINTGTSYLNAQMSELGAYQSQLSAIQNQMGAIQGSSPGQNFSINALYNPGEEGLTEQQNAYKMLLEKQNEVNSSINNSNTSIKQQADAIRDLVLNSDKYADVWQRVQNRIELARNVSGELYNNNVDSKLIPTFTGVRSSLTGENEREMKVQRFSAMRDKNLDIYEKTMTASATYKDDSEKLKEAMAEIDTSLGADFEKGFMAPLREIMQVDIRQSTNDMKLAGDLILEGAEALAGTFNNFAIQSKNILEEQANAFTAGTSGEAGTTVTSSGKVIANFDARDNGTGNKSTAHMTTDEIVSAYIQQNYGYAQGSKEFAQTKRQMKANYTDKEIRKSLAPQITSTGSNSEVYKYNSQMSKKLRGGLSGKESAFSKAGAQYGIDPRLIASIAMAETGGKINSKNNIGGVMKSGGGLKSYGSVDASINDLGRILKEVYFDQGLNTIPEIQRKYAPNGASNDPTGLNSNWAKNVASFYSGMSGVAYNSLLGSSSKTISTSNGSGGSGKKLSGWGGTITSQYGKRTDPITGKKGASHNGIDIAGKAGTRLDSNVSGKVIASGTYGSGTGYSGYGNVVVVKDDNGMQHMYAHLQKTLVKVGDSVKKGQQVGNIGSTGKSTGPHLHYEVRKNGYGTNVDPTSYMNSARSYTGGTISSSGGTTSTVKVKTQAEIDRENAKQARVNAITALKDATANQIDVAKSQTATELKKGYQRGMSIDVGIGKLRSPLGSQAVSSKFADLQSNLEATYTQRRDNTFQISDLRADRKVQAKTRDTLKKGGASRKEEYEEQKKLVAQTDKLIAQLVKNEKGLKSLESSLKRQLLADPTINGAQADTRLNIAYAKIAKTPRASIDYYKSITEANEMRGSYMTNKKKLGILSEYWGETGQQPVQYNKLKRIDAKEDITLNRRKTSAINNVLADFAQGTMDWHTTLQDAVVLLDEINSLEQERLDNARNYFNETGKGVETVVSQDAYLESKETYRNRGNIKTAINELRNGKITEGFGVQTQRYGTYNAAEGVQKKIKEKYGLDTTIIKEGKMFRVKTTDNNLSKEQANNYAKAINGKGTSGKKNGKISGWTSTIGGKQNKMTYAQELATMQLISSIYTELQQQMEDYRSAVTGAYQAGAISLEDYLKELNNLRNLQYEARENSVKMVDNLGNLFATSISSAITEGMEGGFDSSQGFIDSMKGGIASMLSGAISDTLVKNTGIQTLMDGFIADIVGVATGGTPKDILNMFNENDFGTQMEEIFATIVPLIEQIVSSTDGIFNIMKDQLFNAPGGFKIDDHLYDLAKGKKVEGIKDWVGGKDRNEAGSPIGGGVNDDDKTIDAGKPKDKPTGVPPTISYPGDGNAIGTGDQKSPTPAKKPAKAKTPAKTPVKTPAKKTPAKTPAKKTPAKTTSYFWYTIKKGDTLGELADKYLGGSSKYSQIVSLNKGIKATNLQIGQKIKIPKNPTSTTKKPATTPATKTKTVKSAVFLRSAAGYDGKVLQTLPKGAKVQYLGTSKGWAKVKYGGKTGYVGPSYIYHSGGIAGVKNFANANKLKSDEVNAIMKKGELALRPGQILDLVKNLVGIASGQVKTPTIVEKNGVKVGRSDISESRKMNEIPRVIKVDSGSTSTGFENSKIEVNVDIGSNPQLNKADMEAVVRKAVADSVAEMEKRQRKGNLRVNGVSYSK